jgi:hypothetical protein
MGIGDKQLVDEVFVFHPGCRFSAATATLGIVDVKRLTLGVAFMRERHHNIFFGDQVLHGQVKLIFENSGSALVTVFLLDFVQLIADNLQQPFGIGQDIEQFLDQLEYFLVFIQYLVLFKTRKAMQP